MITVTFALPQESHEFIRLLRNRSPKGSKSRVVSGLLRGKDIVVLHTGVGAVAAQERMVNFLQENSPSLVISAGFVGALVYELEVGDLVLASNFSTPKLLAAAKIALYGKAVRVAKLVTAQTMIDSSNEREALAKASKASAVDMETAWIADACTAAAVPMLSLRVVTDSPALPFPAPSHVLFDLKTQRTNRTQLGFYLVTHPLKIGRLAAFGRRVRLARRSLTDALDLLLGSESPE